VRSEQGAPGNSGEARRTTRKAILVVDDEPAIADLIVDVLEGEDYDVDVTHACDGDAALALMTGRRFDLVMSDVMHPGPDGYHVVAAAAALGIPTILMSASPARWQPAGTVVLDKPFDLDALLSTVDALTSAGRRASP
jgi:CheY-like chemotaxis protein